VSFGCFWAPEGFASYPEGKNTPYLGITSDYSTTDSDQIDTRLEAFIDMFGESK